MTTTVTVLRRLSRRIYALFAVIASCWLSGRHARKPAKSAGSTSAQAVQKVMRPRQTDGEYPSRRTLTDAQALNLLEKRRADTGLVHAAEASGSDVPILPPGDTNTRLELREPVARNAPVSFAVQLQWSVQPIDVTSIPPHPIFQAYTLYAAEGRCTGRAWFFLRLGFFSDAISAEQVAHYLRWDFTSATVVPVSSQEQLQVRQMRLCSQAGTVTRRRA
jgi:hypothetical protein